MHVDRDGGDVLMVAGSTGLAPLRALIMDLTRWGENPRVHLFFGARYPCDLYDLQTLWQIASTNPWLSVTPVSEFSTEPAVGRRLSRRRSRPAGCTCARPALLPDVVTRYGNWGDRQILVCGGPQMVAATKAALIAKGAPTRAHPARSARQLSVTESPTMPEFEAVTLTRPVVVADRDLRARRGHDRHLAGRRRRRVPRPAPRPGRLRHGRQDHGHPDPVSVGKSVERQHV